MPGDVVAERYELEQLVGSGGMSSVFRAHDRVLERTVALKVLHERLAAQKDVVDRFSREAKLVAKLSHENIVAVIDRGEHAGSPFIVFEFISGENLKQLVVRSGPLPVERALELAIEIARGLAFAHKQGFVHRDVKPQNVLLNGKGEAKVTDFGIARSIVAHEGETATGTVLGTCDYISPEQAQGRRVDEASDVYSLGIVLYELLTAKVPFTGDNFVAVAMQHINAPPPPVSLERPDVPRRVDAAVEKALAKEPGQRFESMAAFGAELEACLIEVRADEDTSATGIMPVVRPARRPQTRAPGPGSGWRARLRRPRGRTLVAALVAAAAVAAGLAVAFTGGGSGGGNGGGGPEAPIPLGAVATYDPPPGDGHENDANIAEATDGKQSTYWPTESYFNCPGGELCSGSGVKPGVGIVLDAGAAVTAHSITVTSNTPGYTAVIEAGDDPHGPFSVDSPPETGRASTTFRLQGATDRYYVIWITNRGSHQSVHINEVTAS